MAPAGPCSFFTRSPRCEPGEMCIRDRLQCDDLCVVFRGDESTDVYCRDQAYSEPTPIHSITLYRVQRCAEIRLWSEYIVEGDRVLATFDPLMHPTLTVTE